MCLSLQPAYNERDFWNDLFKKSNIWMFIPEIPKHILSFLQALKHHKKQMTNINIAKI